MAFSPIVYPPQFHVAGEPASGYWLKAYRAGTSTAIQMATDRTGNTLVNKIELNSEGRPEVSGNTIIPHIEEENKLALYPTEASADADDTGSAIWIPDNIDVGSLPSSYVDSIDTLSDLRNYSGESRTILLEGETASGDEEAALYYYSSGQSVGTYSDNGGTIIVPTGGDGSAAWLLLVFSKNAIDKGLCIASRTSPSQTITSGSETAVEFNNDSYDPSGLHDDSSNQEQFVPNDTASRWRISCQLRVQYSAPSAHELTIYIKRYSSSDVEQQTVGQAQFQLDADGGTFSTVVQCNSFPVNHLSGDYFAVSVEQASTVDMLVMAGLSWATFEEVGV